MKRVLSLVLALVLVLGTILPVFAEDAMTAGEELKSLGVIAGSDTGLDEDQPLTRAQAAVVISEMYGKKDEAAAYAFPASFTDVEEGMWYTPYIAYAEAQGWMSGDGKGLTFRPMDTMKAQELNAMYLIVLGYTVEWADVNAKATELGFAVDAADATLVLRGEAFASILSALDVMPMDETDTLGTKLALEGYEAPAPATPDALEVVSVKALNLIQVEVMFNQEVDADSAEDADNYEVEDMDIADAALQADMKTVVLTLTEAAAQQDALDVTVDAVETAEEVALEEVVFEDVAFLDTTIPTILSAEVVGIDTIKVTFSEPMTEATLLAKTNYSVDGGDLYINEVTAVNNNTEANITLYSDLEEGDVTVKVKAAVEDEAGFGVVQDTLTATVTVDEDAPVVVAYKDATTTGVTLVFNEEIEIADVTDFDAWYHTNSNSPVVADVELSTDSKEVTLDFTDNELPEGTAYVYVLKETVNDLWDNENAQIMFKVEITVDVTAPEVDSVKVKTEEQIEVKFTEVVVEDDAEDEDNYTILQDGEEVEDIIDNVTYSGKVATIDFDDTLSGDYTIVVKNIEDPAENEMATATVEFNVDDLTAPVFTDFSATVYDATKSDQMIRISFDEEMNAEGNYSVVDPANYSITIASTTYLLTDLVDDYDAEISLVDNGKAVQITCPTDTSDVGDDANGIDFGTGTITIARVSDAAGNYTVAYTGSVTIDAAAFVLIDDVEITAVDTVVVTFDDLLSDFDADDLQIQANGAALELAKKAVSMDSDGNTVVTLTLKTDLDYTGKTVVGSHAVSAIIVDADDDAATDFAPNSENKFGETVKEDNTKVGTDDISPELYDDGEDTVDFAYEDYLTHTTGGAFTVKFTEAVETSTTNALAGNDFVVKADNDTLVNGVDFEIQSISGDTITFIFLGDYLGLDADVTIDRAATTNHVTDASENKLDAFESDEFTVANGHTYSMVEYADALAAVTEGDYTGASWTAYQVVVDANVVTIADTHADIDDAITAITDAQDDLVETP